MKRTEDLIRDGLQTLVTFLVLALLLFHGPFAKAQSTDVRIATVTRLGEAIKSPSLNSGTRAQYMHQLFKNTLPADFPSVAAPVLPEGLQVIRSLLDLNTYEINAELIPRMLDAANEGVRFGGAIHVLVARVLETSQDPEIVDASVRFLKRQIQSAHDRNMINLLGRYRQVEGRFKLTVAACASAVSGRSQVADVAAAPVL
jgi:hypothetical protein